MYYLQAILGDLSSIAPFAKQFERPEVSKAAASGKEQRQSTSGSNSNSAAAGAGVQEAGSADRQAPTATTAAEPGQENGLWLIEQFLGYPLVPRTVLPAAASSSAARNSYQGRQATSGGSPPVGGGGDAAEPSSSTPSSRRWFGDRMYTPPHTSTTPVNVFTSSASAAVPQLHSSAATVTVTSGGDGSRASGSGDWLPLSEPLTSSPFPYSQQRQRAVWPDVLPGRVSHASLDTAFSCSAGNMSSLASISDASSVPTTQSARRGQAGTGTGTRPGTLSAIAFTRAAFACSKEATEEGCLHEVADSQPRLARPSDPKVEGPGLSHQQQQKAPRADLRRDAAEAGFFLLRYLNERIGLARRLGIVSPMQDKAAATVRGAGTMHPFHHVRLARLLAIAAREAQAHAGHAIGEAGAKQHPGPSSMSSSLPSSSSSAPAAAAFASDLSLPLLPLPDGTTRLSTSIKPGTLLISHPFLESPFDRKVILVLEHDVRSGDSASAGSCGGGGAGASAGNTGGGGTIGVIVNQDEPVGRVSSVASSFQTTVVRSSALPGQRGGGGGSGGNGGGGDAGSGSSGSSSGSSSSRPSRGGGKGGAGARTVSGSSAALSPSPLSPADAAILRVFESELRVINAQIALTPEIDLARLRLRLADLLQLGQRFIETVVAGGQLRSNVATPPCAADAVDLTSSATAFVNADALAAFLRRLDQDGDRAAAVSFPHLTSPSLPLLSSSNGLTDAAADAIAAVGVSASGDIGVDKAAAPHLRWAIDAHASLVAGYPSFPESAAAAGAASIGLDASAPDSSLTSSSSSASRAEASPTAGLGFQSRLPPVTPSPCPFPELSIPSLSLASHGASRDSGNTRRSSRRTRRTESYNGRMASRRSASLFSQPSPLHFGATAHHAAYIDACNVPRLFDEWADLEEHAELDANELAYSTHVDGDVAGGDVDAGSSGERRGRAHRARRRRHNTTSSGSDDSGSRLGSGDGSRTRGSNSSYVSAWQTSTWRSICNGAASTHTDTGTGIYGVSTRGVWDPTSFTVQAGASLPSTTSGSADTPGHVLLGGDVPSSSSSQSSPQPPSSSTSSSSAATGLVMDREAAPPMVHPSFDVRMALNAYDALQADTQPLLSLSSTAATRAASSSASTLSSAASVVWQDRNRFHYRADIQARCTMAESLIGRMRASGIVCEVAPDWHSKMEAALGPGAVDDGGVNAGTASSGKGAAVATTVAATATITPTSPQIPCGGYTPLSAYLHPRVTPMIVVSMRQWREVEAEDQQEDESSGVIFRSGDSGSVFRSGFNGSTYAGPHPRATGQLGGRFGTNNGDDGLGSDSDDDGDGDAVYRRIAVTIRVRRRADGTIELLGDKPAGAASSTAAAASATRGAITAGPGGSVSNRADAATSDGPTASAVADGGHPPHAHHDPTSIGPGGDDGGVMIGLIPLPLGPGLDMPAPAFLRPLQDAFDMGGWLEMIEYNRRSNESISVPDFPSINLAAPGIEASASADAGADATSTAPSTTITASIDINGIVPPSTRRAGPYIGPLPLELVAPSDVDAEHNATDDDEADVDIDGGRDRQQTGRGGQNSRDGGGRDMGVGSSNSVGDVNVDGASPDALMAAIKRAATSRTSSTSSTSTSSSSSSSNRRGRRASNSATRSSASIARSLPKTSRTATSPGGAASATAGSSSARATTRSPQSESDRKGVAGINTGVAVDDGFDVDLDEEEKEAFQRLIGGKTSMDDEAIDDGAGAATIGAPPTPAGTRRKLKRHSAADALAAGRAVVVDASLLGAAAGSDDMISAFGGDHSIVDAAGANGSGRNRTGLVHHRDLAPPAYAAGDVGAAEFEADTAPPTRRLRIDHMMTAVDAAESAELRSNANTDDGLAIADRDVTRRTMSVSRGRQSTGSGQASLRNHDRSVGLPPATANSAAAAAGGEAVASDFYHGTASPLHVAVIDAVDVTSTLHLDSGTAADLDIGGSNQALDVDGRPMLVLGKRLSPPDHLIPTADGETTAASAAGGQAQATCVFLTVPLSHEAADALRIAIALSRKPALSTAADQLRLRHFSLLQDVNHSIAALRSEITVESAAEEASHASFEEKADCVRSAVAASIAEAAAAGLVAAGSSSHDAQRLSAASTLTIAQPGRWRGGGDSGSAGPGEGQWLRPSIIVTSSSSTDEEDEAVKSGSAPRIVVCVESSSSSHRDGRSDATSSSATRRSPEVAAAVEGMVHQWNRLVGAENSYSADDDHATEAADSGIDPGSARYDSAASRRGPKPGAPPSSSSKSTPPSSTSVPAGGRRASGAGGNNRGDGNGNGASQPPPPPPVDAVTAAFGDLPLWSGGPVPGYWMCLHNRREFGRYMIRPTPFNDAVTEGGGGGGDSGRHTGRGRRSASSSSPSPASPTPSSGAAAFPSPIFVNRDMNAAAQAALRAQAARGDDASGGGSTAVAAVAQHGDNSAAGAVADASNSGKQRSMRKASKQGSSVASPSSSPPASGSTPPSGIRPDPFATPHSNDEAVSESSSGSCEYDASSLDYLFFKGASKWTAESEGADADGVAIGGGHTARSLSSLLSSLLQPVRSDSSGTTPPLPASASSTAGDEDDAFADDSAAYAAGPSSPSSRPRVRILVLSPSAPPTVTTLLPGIGLAEALTGDADLGTGGATATGTGAGRPFASTLTSGGLPSSTSSLASEATSTRSPQCNPWAGQLGSELLQGAWIAVEHSDPWTLIRDHARAVEVKRYAASSASSSASHRSEHAAAAALGPSIASSGAATVSASPPTGDALWSALLTSLGGEYAAMGRLPRFD